MSKCQIYYKFSKKLLKCKTFLDFTKLIIKISSTISQPVFFPLIIITWKYQHDISGIKNTSETNLRLISLQKKQDKTK